MLSISQSVQTVSSQGIHTSAVVSKYYSVLSITESTAKILSTKLPQILAMAKNRES